MSKEFEDVMEIINRIEERQIFKNKLIQSLILLSVIVTPMVLCFWSALNHLWKEEWRSLFRILGVYAFVIGTIVLCIYVLYRIWWD